MSNNDNAIDMKFCLGRELDWYILVRIGAWCTIVANEGIVNIICNNDPGHNLPRSGEPLALPFLAYCK